jgi:hypothetical protein
MYPLIEAMIADALAKAASNSLSIELRTLSIATSKIILPPHCN